MTREEQIIDAGIEFTLSRNPVCLAGGALWEKARVLNRSRAFEAGAKFADEKPYWHDYINDKEDVPEIGQRVLVHDNVQVELFTYDGKFYQVDSNGVRIEKNDVCGWMPLPKIG